LDLRPRAGSTSQANSFPGLAFVGRHRCSSL
jgi:hypothetical protein